jgi:hypothetical protein
MAYHDAHQVLTSAGNIPLSLLPMAICMQIKLLWVDSIRTFLFDIPPDLGHVLPSGPLIWFTMSFHIRLVANQETGFSIIDTLKRKLAPN